MTTISGMYLHLMGLSVLNTPRENAGTSVAGNNLATEAADEDDFAPPAKSKPGFSAFAALGIEEPPAEEEEDFGGLMVRQPIAIAFIMH